MKVPNLIIPALIAISLLLISRGIIGHSPVTSSKPVIHAPVAQAEMSTSSGTDVNEQLVENISIADSSLSDSATAINPNLTIPNDPYFDNQWALSKIQVLDLWPVTAGNSEILVAVLDTGIDQSHEDLNGKVVAEVNFTDSPTPNDIHGHGTHVAGIIAANSNNSIGIVGIAPTSRLMNVKVADDKGRCQASVVAEGIIWAVDNGASVINISVELRESFPGLEDAVNYAWRKGAIIIAAAGNDGSQSPVYPAYYENCIAVAATRQNDTLAPLSNQGDWLDVAGPGFNIYSTLPNNGYGYKSGTSFATAYVSGLAALFFNVVTDINNNGRVNDEIRTAIQNGCHQISHNGVGHGRIDAANSLAKIGYPH